MRLPVFSKKKRIRKLQLWEWLVFYALDSKKTVA